MNPAMPSDKEESSTNCRDDIIAMLTASGYHRARVACLNDYDRIVGGIAWAITRYDDVAVAANLLYEESEDQNIKLRTEQSEKIIEALNAVGCPHIISAHQLFGLDVVALKNVVQWLLRQVLSHKYKDQHFTEWFSLNPKTCEEAVTIYRRRFKRPNENRLKTARLMKRFDNSIKFDLSLDAKCTLAEYAIYSRTGDRVYPKKEEEVKVTEGGATDNLQEATTKKHVPTSTVREMMEQAVVETVGNDSEPAKNDREDFSNLTDEINIPNQIAAIKDRLVDETTAFNQAEKDNVELNERYNKIHAQIASGSELNVAKMEELNETFKNTQIRAQELRVFCMDDLQKAQNHEELLRRNVDEHGNIEKYCDHKREIMEQFDEKTKLFSDTVRDVLALQYRLDRLMKTTIRSHYRKRNMERIQDSGDLTQEAKAAVIDYNVTVDILTFSKKITGFINELEKSLLAEPASQEYRDAFVSYMNDVRTQLGEYHWKAKQTQEKTATEKNELAALRQSILAKEREVTYTSSELRKLLNLNIELQKMNENLAKMQVK